MGLQSFWWNEVPASIFKVVAFKAASLSYPSQSNH